MKSIFVLWQSLVASSYRSFFTELSRYPDLRLGLAAPEMFQELGSQQVPCAPFPEPFHKDNPEATCFTLPTRTWHIQAVYYRGLRKILRKFFNQKGSNIILCASEPYSLTSFFTWMQARVSLGKDFVFLTYALQNISKRFPFPLRWVQDFIFKRSHAILVLGQEQERVLRMQGYRGVSLDFPLWFDSQLFPCRKEELPETKRVMGYAGSLSEPKGILDFLDCLKKHPEWKTILKIRIAGNGPLLSDVQRLCLQFRNEGWEIECLGPQQKMTEFYHSIDMLIVPSRTFPHWKEQFGRVIVEAEACGVVVLGSDSGAIPEVIDSPDRIFSEGHVSAMSACIERWLKKMNPALQRAQMRDETSKRVNERFSDKALAKRFAEVLNKITISLSQAP